MGCTTSSLFSRNQKSELFIASSFFIRPAIFTEKSELFAFSWAVFLRFSSSARIKFSFQSHGRFLESTDAVANEHIAPMADEPVAPMADEPFALMASLLSCRYKQMSDGRRTLLVHLKNKNDGR
jgi:hypothetical protein